MQENKKIILSNGYKIPANGFGCYKLEPGDETFNAVVNAIKIGYRHIDTAWSYKNEHSVGEAVRFCINNGIVKREELFITTKLTDPQQGYNSALNAFEESINNLGLEYIDAWLIHTPGRKNKNWEELHIDTWRAMEKIYKSGRVKVIGLSQFEIKHLAPLLFKAEIKPMINQIEIHPQFQQRELIEYCRQNNIQVSGWGALNQGLAIKIPLLNEIAAKYSKTVSQVCIKWQLQLGLIPLSRSRSIEHIKQNYNVWDFTISEEDMKRIEAIDNKFHWNSAYGNYFENSPSLQIDSDKNAYVKIFKFLGFIPLLKKKKESNRISRWYFGGIPFLKIDTKMEYMKNCKL